MADTGPALRNEYSNILKGLFIEYTLSPAYMPMRNGRIERSVTICKLMLELNSTVTDLGLADIIQECNNRETTIQGGRSAYQRLSGRQPLLDLPM